MLKRLLALILILAAAAFALSGYTSWWEAKTYFGPGPLAQGATVLIAPHASLRAIAGELEQAGAIKSALVFRLGLIRRNAVARLKAGEYAIPAHASEADIVDQIAHHRVVLHKLTIAEGLTSAAAVALINADPVLAGSAAAAPEEGSLLPETYLFERGTTRAQMIQRIHQAQTELLARLWAARKADLPYASPEDAVILASIVEKETGVPLERGHIAAVFLNRLKGGIKLESDPTIIYGLTGGAPLGHPIRQSELDKPNPYSTYQIAGLPPTPISIPAVPPSPPVLNPPDSEEMFFVADGSGGHAFAKTEAEHEQNVARWRKFEQAHAGQ